MADYSSIEWLYNPFTGQQGSSWNDKYGCTRVSPACANCYITRTPPLRMRGLKFDKAGAGGRTEIVLADPKVLLYPLTVWARKSRMIFVDSLSELWHGAVKLERTAFMYAVMLLASQHVFLTLTKRTRRMRNWLRDPRFSAKVAAAILQIVAEGQVKLTSEQVARALERCRYGQAIRLPAHIWTGTTVEDNQRAQERIPLLTDIDTEDPLWTSDEPLTNEIDDPLDLTGMLRGINWVVFGGESGPPAKATPLDTEPAVGLRPISLPNLARLIDQTRAAGLVPFVKQLGEPWALENGLARRSKDHGGPDRAGRDINEWPENLRVREYPLALAHHTLTYDPANQLALAAIKQSARVGSETR